MGLRLYAALAAITVAVAAPSPLRAQAPTSGAATARLGHLSRHELAVLEPHLAAGPVALVEFSDDTDLPGIILATRVEAPAATVAQVIGNPAAYPRFMPALDRVEVQSRRDGAIAYAWAWRTAIFTLSGTNVMTVYPAGRRRDRGHRIAVESTGGDLGTGRMMWRVDPLGPNRSLVVFSSRMDVREANFLTQQLSRASRSINRSINLSLATVMLLGTKEESERVAGHARPPRGRHELERPAFDVVALAPLLERGDLVTLRVHGRELLQLGIVGRMGFGRDLVRAVMTDPEAFGSALVPGSYARVQEQSEGQLRFEWGVSLPLVGTSGVMTMRDTGSVVEVEGTEGALTGGKWRFDAVPLPWGEAAVVGWADFDPADASWLLEALVSGNAYFRQGLAASSEVMVLRALRSRVRRRAEAPLASASSAAP